MYSGYKKKKISAIFFPPRHLLKTSVEQKGFWDTTQILYISIAEERYWIDKWHKGGKTTQEYCFFLLPQGEWPANKRQKNGEEINISQ